MRHAVIICGSRDWADEVATQNVVAELARSTIVIHGDAKGADRLAGGFAADRGMTVIPMPAQWDLNGKRAGPIRNSDMLRVLNSLGACGYTVAVHAFPLKGSKGTRHMMRIARQASINVINHSPEQPL